MKAKISVSHGMVGSKSLVSMRKLRNSPDWLRRGGTSSPVAETGIGVVARLLDDV